MITANRYHDISCGHRVAGHENKCSHLHGHNYRIHFFVEPYPDQDLDRVGRVLDFSVIKSQLCIWLEENWDHKMLLWEDDPFIDDLMDVVGDDIVAVPFNPTAENMAKFLVEHIGPHFLSESPVRLRKVIVEETRKCSATYEL